MKITHGKDYFVIEDIYSGVLLRSPDKEEFGICMRDGGFEFQYGAEQYSAVNGVLCNMKNLIKKQVPTENGQTTGGTR